MKTKTILISVLAILMLANITTAAEKIIAEDFSNNAIMNTTGLIDTYTTGTEQPYASIFSVYDRRLDNGIDSGKWGGYTTTGGQDMFMGQPLYVGTIAMVRGADSLFGKSTNADIGYLVMLSDTKTNGNETGSYFYTYFPGNKIDLSDNAARIEWDSCDKSGANTNLSVRLILRASDKWIRSSVVNVPVTNAWVNAAAASVQPNLLTYDEVTTPSDTTFKSLLPNDEAPIQTGTAIAPSSIPSMLSNVDGFGMVIAVDLQGIMGMPLRGFYLDALHLKGQSITSDVKHWKTY